MSEQPSDKKEQEEGVDLSRRKLAKVGVAAPVIMTLASKPVFGAQCLSQMMSGNASQDVGDGSCSLGWGDGGAWKDPTTKSKWADALGMTVAQAYGTQVSGNDNPSCVQFEGGALFSAFFDGAITAEPMREVLCKNNLAVESVRGSGHLAQRQNWIAAYLNSGYSTDYVLTPEQVLCFWDGTQELPHPFTDLDDFFESTW